MRIRHRIETPDIEDVKEKIRDHRMTPFVVTALATLLVVKLTTKQQPTTIIIVNG